MKNLSKTDIHIGIAAYLLELNREKEEPLTKEDQNKIREVMQNSLNMLQGLKEPIEPIILDNTLANLLAYIVSNGKGSEVEKINHLSRIVLKTRLILEMVEQTPVAQVLGYIHENIAGTWLQTRKTPINRDIK